MSWVRGGGIALAALVLFVTDRLPMELVGMLVMVALILTDRWGPRASSWPSASSRWTGPTA